MVHVSINTFLKNTESYIDMAKRGINVYVRLDDGTELKLAKY